MRSNAMDGLTVVILAAGEGKRMRSRQPKVLHAMCGRPLLAYPLRIARTVADRIVVVVGPEGDAVAKAVGPDVRTVEQRERLGTGHAVQQARPACGGGPVLVLPGDMPLLRGETIEALLEHHAQTGATATVLTAVVPAPQGYGRVLRQRGRVTGIVEERDATDAEKKVTEINTAVYCFQGADLWAALEKVRPQNDQGEYYLTDVIGILARGGKRIEAASVADPSEALGVNDRRQLAMVAAIQRQRVLERLMEGGVTIIDPATTWIDDTVTIGADTVVHPQTLLQGQTVIGSECVIGLGSQVTGSRLGDRVQLRPYCVLTDAEVEDEAELGPFCHLRPQAHIGSRARIGNFVEVKKSRIGRGSKAPHLSYIGDATVGDGVNVGAGTVTCNYDGEKKHPTVIGDRVFVGTNSTLVAPVTIGEGAYVGGGSVVTHDVPPGALALGRARQVVKDGWAARRAQRRAPAKPAKEPTE
jgi:bifunctional UDP-N-acetylglucosamine pyrophosphorylase/glucosamine-1-phosphate N-acetyltransferase